MRWDRLSGGRAVPLKAGILIIGSLIWAGNGGRPEWRKRRLDLSGQRRVRAPIRYGRLSRTGTYTMVFAELEEHQYGVAIAVPCRNPVSTASELITEAEWLWAAEERRASLFEAEDRNVAMNRPISNTWGCVALLRNPGSVIPQTLLDAWAKHVSHRYKASPERLVSEGGVLEIKWPKEVDKDLLCEFDLLLATSNNPTMTPTELQIAEAWSRHPGSLEYFQSNRGHGITTFQDEAILRDLRRFPMTCS